MALIHVNNVYTKKRYRERENMCVWPYVCILMPEREDERERERGSKVNQCLYYMK